MSNTLPTDAIDDGKEHDDSKRDEGMEELKEQDRWLPIANVARIMKSALPDNAKIAKEAKETMQECVSEFISFITSEASEKCQAEKRKTVNGEDILFAMTSLGFENYSEALKIYLAKYRETQRPDPHSPTSPTTKAQSPTSPAAPSATNANAMFPSQYPMAINSMNMEGFGGESYMYGHGVHNGVGDPYSSQM